MASRHVRLFLVSFFFCSSMSRVSYIERVKKCVQVDDGCVRVNVSNQLSWYVVGDNEEIKCGKSKRQTSVTKINQTVIIDFHIWSGNHLAHALERHFNTVKIQVSRPDDDEANCEKGWRREVQLLKEFNFLRFFPYFARLVFFFFFFFSDFPFHGNYYWGKINER